MSYFRHRFIMHLTLLFLGSFLLSLVITFGLIHNKSEAETTEVTQPQTLPAIADAPKTEEKPADPAPSPAPKKEKTPATKAASKATAKQEDTPAPATTDQPASQPAAPVSHIYPSHVGVNIKIYGMNKPYAPYNRDNLIAQLDYAKELGATDVRSNAEESPDDTDDFVNLTIERGMRPMLVLEPDLPDFFNQATYAEGYAYANKIASRYQGKVKYYQLGNEASGVAIKKNSAGQSPSGKSASDYDDGKYAVLKEWLRGLSDGVHAANPSAYRMISANWLGTGIFDRLMDDNIQFEIIGWNWYSDMGNDLIKEVDGAQFSIPDYLKKYPKEFWVVELNRQGGTLDGNEQAQADFFQSFITNATSHNNVGGIFVFSLADLCPNLDTGVGRMGIIRLRRQDDGTCVVDDKKPAFDVVKSLFAKFK